jgi:hypothetical protein
MVQIRECGDLKKPIDRLALYYTVIFKVWRRPMASSNPFRFTVSGTEKY